MEPSEFEVFGGCCGVFWVFVSGTLGLMAWGVGII